MKLHSLHPHVLSFGGAGINVVCGHFFCISCKIPDSVATIYVFSGWFTAYFNKAAVDPTTSASFKTVLLHSGCASTNASGCCCFISTIFSTENSSCTWHAPSHNNIFLPVMELI